MKTYADRKPPFLWKKQHPREVYIVLNADEATEYGKHFSDLRRKVRERADQIFGRSLTPKVVKVCDEKGKELNAIERTPTTPAKATKIVPLLNNPQAPEPKPPAQAPATKTAAPRTNRQAERIEKIKFMTREQVKDFFSVITDKRDKALFLLIYKRGLRASEPGLLLVEDYHRKTGKLYVRRLKGSLSGLHLLQRDEIRALNAWLKEREEKESDSSFLFPGREASHGISRKMVFHLAQHYGEKAGTPEDKRHPHALKHSVATHLLEIGADVRDVQDALGHADIDSTLIYAVITSKRRDKLARDVASKLPNF